MTCCSDLLQRLATLTSGLDFQQLKGKELLVQPPNEKPEKRHFNREASGTDSDVEAQQVADHRREGRQDDHPGEVVDQRVHSQAQQSEGGIQLLGGRGERKPQEPHCNRQSERNRFLQQLAEGDRSAS